MLKRLVLAFCCAAALSPAPANAESQWARWLGAREAPIVQVTAHRCTRLQEEKYEESSAHLAATPATVNRVGTGFLYRTGATTVVVTARHVVMGCPKALTVTPVNGQQVQLSDSAALPADVQGCSAEGDFAVLSLPPRTWPPALQGKPHPKGAPLEMVGIPWGAKVVQATSVSGDLPARLDLLVNAGQLPAFQMLGSPAAGTRLYRLDAGAEHGDSGGPLLSWVKQPKQSTLQPVVAGMTLAVLGSMSFYLPIEFVDAELPRVNAEQCGIRSELAGQLPLPAGTLPHVAESSTDPCELGIARLLASHLSHEELTDLFLSGKAIILKQMRHKIGAPDRDQSFSRLKLGELDLVVPEVDDTQASGDIFNEDCRIEFGPSPAHRPHAYRAELIVAPPTDATLPQDKFGLAHWSRTKLLWQEAPESFTLDRLDRVQRDVIDPSTTLAFVAHRPSAAAQLYYLAQWEPEEKWMRACLNLDVPRSPAAEKSCIRERADFIAFAEAVSLLNQPAARARNVAVSPAPVPLNEMRSEPINHIR